MKNSLNANITDFLRQKALDEDRSDCLVGFADIAHIVEPINEHLPYSKAISFSLPLDPGIVSRIPHGSTQEYADEFRSIDASLQRIGNDLKFYLSTLGYQSMTFDEALLSLNEAGIDRGDIPSFRHRVIATNAGLGWIGKNGLIVTKLYGSAVKLSTILTNAPVDCCTQSFLSRCGRCVECIDACPNNSEFNSNPATALHFEGQIDSDKCVMGRNRQDTEGVSDATDREFCGICIYSCPYTKAYLGRNGL